MREHRLPAELEPRRDTLAHSVTALLVGGVIAAPIAAWIVRHLDARILGTAVGGWIILTNANTFLEAVGLSGSINIPL
jgi:uncharacterized membrane protein YfcA